MHFYETPTGQRLALGLTHEMVHANHALDSLRALAYRDGVAPLFTDEGNPTASPWDTRQDLVCDLSDVYARLDTLRTPAFRGYLSPEMCMGVSIVCATILFTTAIS